MKDRKNFLVKVLVASFACCMVTAVGASCNRSPSDSTGEDSGNSSVQDYQISGNYYYIEGATEYSISLTEDGSFTLSIAGQTITGTYTYDGSTLNLLTDSTALTSASLQGDVLTLTYDGASYAFEKTAVYTVTFSVDGETSTVRVKDGDTVERPEDPEMAGDYLFAGWYTNSSFSLDTKFSFSQPITRDITLYARFVNALKGPFEFEVNFDLGYTGGEAIAPMTTTEGKVYNLPEPEREGYEFVGWWMSDYGSSDRLTCQYNEQTIEENTTLYAVWASDDPIISVDEDGVTWSASGVGNSYTLVIEKPDGERVERSLSTTSFSYDFSAEEAGDYVITVTVGSRTATAYYRNKALTKVSIFKVEDYIIQFNPVDGAEKYTLTIDCGNASHNHTAIDLGTNTYYDFSSCDMQEGGIIFTVTAEADGYLSSTSESFVFEQHLAPVGTISRDADTEEVSWDAVENATSYTVTVLLNGEQVYSGSVGSACSYGLKTYGPGTITVRVTPVARYYNSPAATEYVYEKTRLATPANVRVEGMDIVWDAVAGATGYTVRIGDEEHTVTGTSYAFSEEDYVSSGITVSVCAIGATAAQNSVYSDVFTVRYGEMGDELTYSDGVVSWEPVFGIDTFIVRVNGGEEIRVENANSCAVTLTRAGSNTISVCAVDAEGGRSEWVETTVTAYAIVFDAGDGAAVETVYRAEGDAPEFAESTRTGYDFSGWYTQPNGEGTRYDTLESLAIEEDVTLYAAWTARQYDITFDVGTYGPEEGLETQQVTYDSNFTLSVPESASTLKAFAGWYTSPNGEGIQITDYTGSSLTAWRRTNAMTVYAYWVDIFSFTSQVAGGYAVSAGEGANYVGEITIPETYNGQNVLTVNSFAGCTNLRVIHIPDTVELISLGTEGTAFLNCTSLRTIDIYETGNAVEPVYTSVGGVLFSVDELTLIYFPANAAQAENRDGVYEIPAGTQIISDNAFSHARNITEITIPASVTTIGNSAFAPRSSVSPSMARTLTKVTFLEAEEGVEEMPLTLGVSAFAGCRVLTEITLPGRLVSISATDAFENCDALENVYVVGEGNYSDEDGVLCVSISGGKEIIYYPVAKAGDYVVPTSVISIGDYAFNRHEGLTKITFHEGVTHIGYAAFERCDNLAEIVFEGTANSFDLTIEEMAFYNNDNDALTSVTLPANLVSLGEYAFGDSAKLTTVYVNSGANSRQLNFANGAFSGTSASRYSYVTTVYLGADVPLIDVAGIFGSTRLSNVIVDENNQNYEDVEGVLYNRGVTELIFYPSTRTGEYVLPETVTRIGNNAFAGKTGLTKITIGANVTEIGNSAFESCSGLQEVVFAASSYASLTIGSYAFEDCTRLTTINLPEGLTSIGAMAFSSTALTSITLPSTLASMGELKTDTSGSYYYLDVFDDCDNLTAVNVAEGNNHYASIDGILYAKSVVDPDAETPTYYISALAFCPVMNSGADGVVDIPSSVRAIWRRAFYRNEGVVKITFSEGLKEVTDPVTGVSVDVSFSLDEEVFYQCWGLESVELPNGMTTIAANTFYQCYALSEVTIPNTVTSIETQAFSSCSGLKDIYFEEGGTEALVLQSASSNGYGVFYGCTGLETITFPERTTEIGDYAFNGCTSLKVVNIPASVTSIGQYAFRYAPLEEVNFAAGSKLTELGNFAFYGSVLREITLPENLQVIGNYVFESSHLESIVIPASVTEIGMSAFGSCQYLTSIVFEDGSRLADFGNSACMGCTNLTEVDFGARDTENRVPLTFDRQVFKYCTSLESIVFPADTTELGLRVFEGCTALKSITFGNEAPSLLESIEDNAFWSTGITEFVFPTVMTEGTEETPAEVRSLSLGTGLFKGCSKLTKVTLSPSVTNIDQIFVGCVSLQQIIVAEGNVNFMPGDLPVIFNQNGTSVEIVYGNVADASGAFTVPAGTLTIAAGAFAGREDIVSITIPASVESIGNYAFAGCTNLQYVYFEEGSALNSLGQYAFQNCLSLKEIALPSSLTSLSTYTFDYCRSLTKVTLPSKLTSIGNYAFRYCTSLAEISIPQTVDTFGTYVFDGCTSLASVDFNGNETVTKLGNYMFRNCTALKTITLPASLTFLGTYTFQGSGLTSIDLSNLTSLQYLGSSATACSNSTKVYLFADCADLQEVRLPVDLKGIGAYVFYNCVSLKTIDLGNIERLANYSFYNTGLTSVTIPKLGASYVGTYIFAECADLESVTILEGTTKLSNNDFQNCTSLKEVIIPSTVTTIQGSVFRGCTSLEEIALPGAITTFGTYIFEGCTALSEVNFGEQSTITKLGDYMFQNCTALKSISLPSTLTYLGTYTFQNSGLTSIDLSGLTGLTRLGTSATTCTTSTKSYVFADCKDLTAVTLPSGLTRIGGYAFYGCENLASVNLSNLVQINAFAFAGTAISEVSLSAATEFIGGGAFAGCAALESISIPVTNTAYRTDDGVLYTADGTIVCYPAGKVPEGGTVTLEEGQNIGAGAFAGCTNVTTVVIPEGMTEIDEYAFYDSSVREVVLPESLTTIGTYAFAFSDIESITIPASLEFIGDYAFAFSALKEATIEATALVKSSSTSSITGITTYTYAQYLFQNCEQLAAVHLPEGFEIIVTGMFQNCYSLESIDLPKTVTTINMYAFDGSGLKSFTFNDNIEIVQNYAFQNSALEEVTINIEAFISAISTSNGAITYASYVFQNCTSLARVNFGAESGFNYIGQYMFAGCTALKSITIPDTVTTIQKGAFSGSGLVSITIPDSIVDPGVTSSGIYMEAFENCTSLESVVLPSSTKLIEDSLFAGCTALKSITIPRTISVISTNAFAGCTALKDLYIPIEVYDLSTSNTALFEGWTSEQTVHFEATKAQIYLNWDIGWDMNTDATFVFGETQGETSEN